ncbi:superoxide dismutase [Cu-Zn] SodC [Paucibacter sp. DJ2R-2]|uniref:superoxide dismutase [Cu-Zn] SodC n=1 Tax=Paucibacter sp. DJ2R-2 TaxID=2893558 RepID=UPI0021E359EC|nr:superoxide dismutase [Cu-Zn] SodC [Paucibacter sp. DJ2R-2]MCV2438687.1 superoxide dismutase family protein [Paucibacter sp. DJ2R-2]
MALALFGLAVFAGAGAAHAVTVPMSLIDQDGREVPVGSIEVQATTYGVKLIPNLYGLPPGLHGFHVHEKPSCGPSQVNGKAVVGGAAGGHFDPAQTAQHLGPWGDGHLGDLPSLYVDAKGQATNAVVAPRLRSSDLKGRSLMIHAGGDNHADHPVALGGGGARIACGVLDS